MVALVPLDLSEASLTALQEDVSADAFSLRTLGYERALYCEPVSLEATGAYNVAFVVAKDALEHIGGIDFCMGAAAATDIIKRLSLDGKKTKYLPSATVEAKGFPCKDYEERLVETLKLRIKFGRACDIKEGYILILKALAHPAAYAVTRKRLIAEMASSFFKTVGLLASRLGKNRRYANTSSEWYKAEYGLVRGEIVTQPNEKPLLVSVVTRTRNRPETLRKTLESLRNQTYKNFETVVIEDGEPLCEGMLLSDFSDMRITYKATGKSIGRAAAANMGVKLAKGEYINFLDDDDYLLPEHIEIGVQSLLSKETDLVFLQCIALEANVISEKPYKLEIVNKNRLEFPRIDPFTMVRRCVTTDNGVIFRRALYEKAGGMREELGAHEDWNLWLRLMSHGRYETVAYATCCYVVPADKELERKRLEAYSKFDDRLLADSDIVFKLSQEELKGFQDSVIHDYMYLHTLGIAKQRAKEETGKRKELYGEKRLLEFSGLSSGGKTLSLTGEELRQLYYSETDKIYQSSEEGRLSEYLSMRYSELTR